MKPFEKYSQRRTKSRGGARLGALTNRGIWPLFWAVMAVSALAALFTVISLAAGCLADPSYETSLEPPRCEVAADCPVSGQLCSLDGHCFFPADPNMNLAVELVPQSTDKDSSGSPKTRTEFAPGDLQYLQDGSVRLTYKTPVEISGDVSVVNYAFDGTGYELFDAQVSVWRRSRIPGRPKVLYTKTLSLDMTTRSPGDQISESFLFHVPADEGYTLRASPQGYFAQVYPPMVVRNLAVQEDYSQSFLFDLEGQYLRASGRVVDAMGMGVSGIQARLEDPEGIYSSTLSAPTEEDGEFVVALPLGKRNYTLELTPVGDATAMPEIQFHLQDVGSETLNTTVELSDSEGQDFTYPALLSPCEYVYTVMGISAAGTREPVSGAVVSFTTHVGGGSDNNGHVSNQGATDANGRVRVHLIPGVNRNTRLYEVTVVPPMGSNYASRFMESNVSRCGGTGADLELTPRTEVVGRVQTTDGVQVSNVTLQARPSNAAENQGTPSSLITSLGIRPTETTGENGKFFLKLDPGFYDLELVPPGSSFLPRWLVSNVEIHEGLSKTINVEIPGASLFLGRIVNSDGEPVSGFDVKVYMVADECLDSETCETPAFFLGEGSTQEDGRFQVLIPRPE